MSRTFIVLMIIILTPVAYVLGSVAVEIWSEPENQVDLLVDGSITPGEREKAVLLLNRFREECPKLFTSHASDIERMQLTYDDLTLYRGENHGWTQEAKLTVKIGNDSRVAPGHTVRYFISGTGEEGWVANKNEATELCGKDGSRGGYTFFPF
ncbi:hypothetical protein [Marinobacter adhaerens]|uniref:hypothetical protein n=1 Tax=Marinobacter adhaerens TaxID=1033846 RepID=UPI003BACEC4E